MGNRFPPHEGRATIAEVAAMAGVSKGTVSKYLNGNGKYYVAEKTRTVIEEAIRALQFEPNSVAQSLVSRRTHTIGVVVASIRNAFYPDLVAGIEDVVEPAGYTLVLGSTNSDPGREAGIVKSLINRRVDGVVMASVRMRAGEVERVSASGLPVVLASRDLPGSPTDVVVIDNLAGGRLAVEHLVGVHGHRRVAHVAGPQDVAPFKDRCSGWAGALRDAGLADDGLLVQAESTDGPAGGRALTRLLDAGDRPTAVFVANDTLALGVLERCAELGIRVPQDLAVVAFDNIWVSGLAAVSLTTVDSKARMIGRAAAGILVDRIADTASGDSPERVVLRPELVVRRSCGCAGG